jgi:acyl carrier protein
VVLQKAFGVKLREEPRVREVRTLGDIHKLVMIKQQEMAAEESD